jgi:hypothetical protein
MEKSFATIKENSCFHIIQLAMTSQSYYLSYSYTFHGLWIKGAKTETINVSIPMDNQGGIRTGKET